MPDNQRDDEESLHRAAAGAHNGMSSIFSSVGVFSRYAWNAQMRFLVSLGLMPLFRQHWWLFLVVAFALLAIALPLGVIWVAVAFFALNSNPAAENDYLVEIKSKEDDPPSYFDIIEDPNVRSILSALAHAQDGTLEKTAFKLWLGIPSLTAENLLSHLARFGLVKQALDAPTESYLITDEGRALVTRMGW